MYVFLSQYMQVIQCHMKSTAKCLMRTLTYLWQDTCSSCDQYSAEVRIVEHALKNYPEESHEKHEAEKKLLQLTTEKKLHLMKANMFYIHKRASKENNQKSIQHESTAMDFQKNVAVPNILTNDVYYRGKLTVCMFNIHLLSTEESYFFVYDETVVYKGADEVASFLFYFVMNIPDISVKNLDIFCDSCGARTKTGYFSIIVNCSLYCPS